MIHVVFKNIFYHFQDYYHSTNYIFLDPVIAEDFNYGIISFKNGKSPGIDNVIASVIKIAYPK